MEAQLAAVAVSEAKRPQLRMTWLNEDQLRDAEASVLISQGRRLTECVVAADRVLPPVQGIKCPIALEDWVEALKKRKRSWRTIENNVGRMKAFIAFAGVATIEAILPRMIEDWVYRDGTRADFTRITEARILRAWLNHCKRRRWLLVSPFEVDMKDMQATARHVETSRILSPAQAHALLAAAREVADGLLVPYVILSTWCFMSPQEVVRTTREKMKLDGATPIIEVDTVKRRTAKFRTVTVPAGVLPLLRRAVSSWPATHEIVPRKTKEPVTVPYTVPFNRAAWDRVRERAGLIERGPLSKRGRRRSFVASVWQDNILRHTGISYLFQSLSAKAQAGNFEEKSVIAEVCRQAGNTNDTAFRHYLSLPEAGASVRFYGEFGGQCLTHAS